MDFVWTLPGILNALTGLFFVALGVLVAAVGRRRRLNHAFAVFAIAWGLGLTYINVVSDWPLWLGHVDLWLNLVAATGLILVGIWVSPRRARKSWHHVAAASAVAMASMAPYWWSVYAAIHGLPFLDDWETYLGPDPPVGAILRDTLLWPGARAAWWFALSLIALRFYDAEGPRASDERRTYALVSAGLLLWPAAWTALAFGLAVVGMAAGIGAAIGLLLVLSLWIRNTTVQDVHASHWARNVALVGILATLASFAINFIWTFSAPSFGPEFAIARIVGVSLLAYVVLRHHLFGIEIHAKRFLRVATIVAAAVTLAGGIVLAGLAMGSGNPLVATAAAFLVAVFLAFLVRNPLAAFGHFVAERAMPRVKATGSYYEKRRLEIYSAALSDLRVPGSPTRSEERFLRGLRRQLGITDSEDRFLRGLGSGRHEGASGSGNPALDPRLEPYVRALRRHLLASADTSATSTSLRALRADLGITDREHALLELAFRHAGPTKRNQEALQPDQVFLGRYQVRRLLGSGGFAKTYLCTDPQTGRDAVIKVLEAFDDEDGAKTAFNEARAIAAIQHPRVVTLFDVEVVGNEAFVVMEYLPGGCLRDRIGQGPMRGAEFASLARDLLSGLAAVHEAGLVHGDVKPSNVLLSRDGRAKLADFGLSRPVGFDSTMQEGHAGGAAGTTRYMSPEVARGSKPSRRSDLFSAAATLYEAYTGRPYVEPRARETAYEVQMRVANLSSFPRVFAGPPMLGAWFRVGLEPNANRRFVSAQAMLDAFNRTATGPVGAAPKAVRRGRPTPA